MRIRLVFLCALLLSPVPVSAQETTPEETAQAAGPEGFWQATLPGGHYMVALARITAVSRHQYLLDGAVVVDEVTIDTDGQSLARFYHLTPVNERAPGAVGGVLSDRAAELVDRAGQFDSKGLQFMVVKKYPETTHARTIEYRLATNKQLTALYDSVRKAWEENHGVKFSVK